MRLSDSLPPVPPGSVAFAGWYRPCVRLLRSRGLWTPPTASLDLWSCRNPHRRCSSAEMTGPPRFLEGPQWTYAVLFDPGRADAPGPCGAPMLSPLHHTRTTSAKFSLSRLDHTASALAVYASQAPLRCRPRKTRFRLVANLCRAGLVTRQIPSRKVSDSADLRLHRLPPSPGFAWRTRRLSSRG
jgi:hypothetical protein